MNFSIASKKEALLHAEEYATDFTPLCFQRPDDRFWPQAELQAMTLPQAALRSAGGGSSLRQRPIQRAVSFS